MDIESLKNHYSSVPILIEGLKKIKRENIALTETVDAILAKWDLSRTLENRLQYGPVSIVCGICEGEGRLDCAGCQGIPNNRNCVRCRGKGIVDCPRCDK